MTVIRAIKGVSFATDPKDHNGKLLGYGVVLFTVEDELGNTWEHVLTAGHAAALGYGLQTSSAALQDSLSANARSRP
jgi:hypothetical protein